MDKVTLSEEFEIAVGQTLSDDDMKKIEGLRQEGRDIHIMPPGAHGTTDMRMNRLRIYVDDEKTVTRLKFG